MPYAKSSLYKLINGNNFLKEMRGGSTENMTTVFQLMSEKKQFLLLTFANLIIQLGITYYVMEKYTSTLRTYENVGLVILLFVILIGMSMIPMPSWAKFLLFSILSAILGLFLSSLKTHISPEIINLAIVGTISIYGIMFLIGLFLLMTGIQLSYQFGLALFYILFALILFEIITYFMGTASLLHKTFGAIGLILFSFYIIYDTNHILQRNYYGDFITASMDYYLDILNVFTSLINLTSN